MGKRLLASFLAAAMMLTMAPFAFAADTKDDSENNTSSSSEAVKKVTSEEELKAAISSAIDGDTIQLGNNIEIEKKLVYSKQDITVTLDLNSFTLTGPGNDYTVDSSNANGAGTGKIVIKNGAIKRKDGATGTNSTIRNYQTMELDNVKAEGNFIVVKNEETATLTLNNCELTAPAALGQKATSALQNWGIANVSNSTLTAGNALLAASWADSTGSYDSMATLNDCALIGEYHSISSGRADQSNASQTITVTGGTCRGDVNSGAGSSITICSAVTGNLEVVDEFEYTLGTAKYKTSAPSKVTIGEGGSISGTISAVAEISGTYYSSLTAAFADAQENDTVKLLADVETKNIEDTVDARIIIDTPITLDLNDKTITSPNGMGNNNTNFCALIIDADTTINATTGGINTGTNGGYAINVRKGATLTINGGEYYGGGTDVQVQKGTLIVNGGTFDAEPFGDPYGCNFMINCVDSAYRDGTAKVSIKGGTFAHFNPANNTAEGAGTNFLAPGYKTELTNGVYVVKAGTNDAINALDKAVTAVKDDDDVSEANTKTDVAAAVAAVKDIPNETLSANSTTMDKLATVDTAIQKGGVLVSADSSDETVENVTATNAALSADPNEAAKQTISIDVATKANASTEIEAAKNVVTGASKNGETKALDITMKLNEQTITEPTAPVVLTFDLPTGWNNAQIVYVDGDKTELVKTTVSNGKVSGVFNHFSTYVLVQTEASKNPNEYEIILTPNTYDVSAGDTLTYTVSLKHTEGDGTEGMFTFVPDTTSGLLSDGKFTPETGLANYQFGKDNGKDKLVLKELNLPKSETKIIGTLSYTVQAYPDDNTKIEYTGTSEGTVSNEGRQVEATVRLINDKDVTYHVVKVTFSAADGTTTEGYVKYGESSPLYATLDALKSQDDTKKVTVPALSTAKANGTGGADYRVLDDKWHLSTDDTQVYPLTSGIKTSVTFVENYVKLAKVTISQDNNKNLVQITKEVTRTVGDDSYVDQGADLEFKLTDDAIPKPGMKYEVKVKVGGGEAFDPDGPDPDGTYKVEGTKITGNVEFVLTQKMALTADDIKIFTDTDTTGKETYRDYSTYSGKKTLVLIKGDAGAKYQFNTTTEQHPTIYKTDAYDGYNFGVLIDPTNVGADKASMLAYMVNKLGLNVVTSTEKINPTIKYDFNTNGLDGAPLADAQVTRDFIRKAAENGWYWKPTDDLLLKADVITAGDGANPYDKNTYNGTADGRVSADDLNTFMYLYVGMPKTN